MDLAGCVLYDLQTVLHIFSFSLQKSHRYSTSFPFIHINILFSDVCVCVFVYVHTCVCIHTHRNITEPRIVGNSMQKKLSYLQWSSHTYWDTITCLDEKLTSSSKFFHMLSKEGHRGKPGLVRGLGEFSWDDGLMNNRHQWEN